MFARQILLHFFLTEAVDNLNIIDLLESGVYIQL